MRAPGEEGRRGGAPPIVVGVADLQTCHDPEGVLVTYALGSCIAVCVHDPVRKVGGMLHYMLPLSRASSEKAKSKPAMFADTGVPLLFKRMYALGCQKKDLVVKVAGGSTQRSDKDMFQIGKRNFTILRKLFWKNGVMISGEDIGGLKSRTVRLFIGDGRVLVSSQGDVDVL